MLLVEHQISGKWNKMLNGFVILCSEFKSFGQVQSEYSDDSSKIVNRGHAEDSVHRPPKV